MKCTTKVSTKETKTIELSGADLISLLRSNGLLPPDPVRWYEVTIQVPGGGDWSGRDLDVDDYPVVVKASFVTTEDK